MPKGIYERTEEHKIKIGLAHRGMKHSDEAKKKMGDSHRGKKFSKELREKLSKSHIGQQNSLESRKRAGETLKKLYKENPEKVELIRRKLLEYNKKHPRSLETREKIRNNNLGEKSHLWHGGVSSDNELHRKKAEIREWKKSVYIRDNYTCQRCKQYGGRLVAHHIFNFSSHPEIRNFTYNGVTLCCDCHKNFHKQYGLKNNEARQLTQFLKDYAMGDR